MVVSDDELASFREQGYLVVPDFVDHAEITRLKSKAASIVDDFDPRSTQTIFTTLEQTKTSDEWFFRSASSISCFYEDGVLDDEGNLTVDKAQAINKIGHALHEERGSPFRDFTESDAVKDILVKLGYVHPIAVQSMYIMKSAKVGGVVSAHQDATFLSTEPRETVVGFWVALEDATIENGCLWAAPGSHRSGKVFKSFRRKIGEGGCELVGDDIPPIPVESSTPLEVKAGTLVLLDGRLVHWSDENKSGKSRHAFSVHVVESDGVTWPARNWLQRTPECPFSPLY